MGLRVKRNILLFAVAAIMISSLYSLPNQVKADPPPAAVPQVFCFKIMDVALSQTVAGRVTIEFEVLNWTDTPANGVELVLARPVNGDVFIVSGGIDANGRPLFSVDVDGDGSSTEPADAGDLKDTNGNGVLDPGEDTNNSGRLDNDPAPGNQPTSNNWSVTSTTNTKVVWAGGTSIPNRDLIGAGSILLASALIPHVAPQPAGPLGQTTVDNSGLVTPLEAIDDGTNVLDGFTVTFDSFDVGDTVTLNWLLTSNGNPLGTSNSGNAYGFGTLSFARIATAGSLPPGVFVPNSGFAQTQNEFFDSVFIVSQLLAQNNPPVGEPSPSSEDNIVLEIGSEFGAGITGTAINPSDMPSESEPNVGEIITILGREYKILVSTLIDDPEGHKEFIDPSMPKANDSFSIDYIFELPAEFLFDSAQLLSGDFAGATNGGAGSLQFFDNRTRVITGTGNISGFGNGNTTITIPSLSDPNVSQLWQYEIVCGPCPDSNGNGIDDPLKFDLTVSQKPQIVDIFVNGTGSSAGSKWTNGDTMDVTLQRNMDTSVNIDPINDISFLDLSSITLSLGISASFEWIDSDTLRITADDATGATLTDKFTITFPSNSFIVAADGAAIVTFTAVDGSDTFPDSSVEVAVNE